MKRYARSISQWSLRPPRVQLKKHLRRMGSDYGGYFVDLSVMPPDPVIYSLGVGEDISFDLCLIEQYGFTVHAFDPTPKVQTWIESRSVPDKFRFQAVGIADFDGEAEFYLPPRPDFISHSLIQAQQYSGSSIRVPVAKLSTVMGKLGHTRVDLLKMDIEGAEYSVLADLLREKIEVRQIVVEFHHRLSSIGIRKSRDILSSLNNYGMRICYLCPRLEVMTLIREGVVHQK
jgi:FkbM family methyltransferase